MKTTEDWEIFYKRHLTTKDFTEFYRTANDEAESIGYRYMTGQLSITDVTTWLNTTGSTWPFRRSGANRFLKKGVVRAIKDGTALVSRVQPEQDFSLDRKR